MLVLRKAFEKEKQSVQNIFGVYSLVFFPSPNFSPQAQSETG